MKKVFTILYESPISYKNKGFVRKGMDALKNVYNGKDPYDSYDRYSRYGRYSYGDAQSQSGNPGMLRKVMSLAKNKYDDFIQKEPLQKQLGAFESFFSKIQKQLFQLTKSETSTAFLLQSIVDYYVWVVSTTTSGLNESRTLSDSEILKEYKRILSVIHRGYFINEGVKSKYQDAFAEIFQAIDANLNARSYNEYVHNIFIPRYKVGEAQDPNMQNTFLTLISTLETDLTSIINESLTQFNMVFFQKRFVSMIKDIKYRAIANTLSSISGGDKSLNTPTMSQYLFKMNDSSITKTVMTKFVEILQTLSTRIYQNNSQFMNREIPTTQEAPEEQQ